jgi:hypothetical protein
MKTLSYFIEAAAELDLALNLITEKIPCLADWYLLDEEDDHIVVTVTCRQEDAAFVERMLAPFV